MRDGSDRLVATLRAYLENVPFLKTASWKKEARLGQFEPHLVAKLVAPAGEQVIIAESRASGQPRIAREAVNLLVRYREESPGMYGVFLAPHISPQAGAICEKAGIGYADLAGNCRLVFGQVYIERRDWPNPAIEKRVVRSLFTPKATRILSLLLSNPRRSWKVLELAKEARVSLGQASNVKQYLEDQEWVERSTKGLRPSRPDELLAAWASAAAFHKKHAWDDDNPTQRAGIEAELAAICREMGIERASSGLSPIQLYLELKRMKGRGDEAAEAILERVIKPTW